MSNESENAVPRTPREAKTRQPLARDVHPLDVRLARLKGEVLPAAPYLLRTEKALNAEHLKAYYPQNSISWRRYSPFRVGEEDLQYVTFKDRSKDSEVSKIMSTISGWDDGKGKIRRHDDAPNRTSSDSTPRQGQVPRKKITLADYKNRERNKTNASTTAAASSSVEDAANKENKKVDVVAVNGTVKPQKAEPHGQKRSAT